VDTVNQLVSIYKLSGLSLGTWKCMFLFFDVRDVLQCTMITHQILLRGAAQCYLLQTAMNLVDVEKVSLSDVSTFLMSLRQEESLGRGTSLWTELCDWLRVNESCFRRASASISIGLPETSSLNAYVKNLVREYIKSPAWESNGRKLPYA